MQYNCVLKDDITIAYIAVSVMFYDNKDLYLCLYITILRKWIKLFCFRLCKLLVLTMTLVLVEFMVVLCAGVSFAEVYYAAEFSDDIVSCPDFDNQVFKADDLHVGMVAGDDEEDDGLGLSGSIEIKKAIEDGNEIQIKISKAMEVGKELMYSVVGDICSSLNNEDAPWYSLASALDWKECPIPVEVYNIADMKMSVNFAKDVLSHDFCGEYEVELSVINGPDTLSCHIIYISIVEKETD